MSRTKIRNKKELPKEEICASSPFPGAIFNVIVFILIMIPLSFTTFIRNRTWKEDLTLWEDVVRKTPEKARGYTLLGFAFFKKDQLDRAI